MNYKFKNRRWPLLWRTVFLLTIFVVISQVIIYIWVQRSVNDHFEQMDSEIITHAAFNLRKRVINNDEQTVVSNTPTSSLPTASASTLPVTTNADHLHSSWLDYDLKILLSDEEGKILSSAPSNFADDFPVDFNLLTLWQAHHEQQFVFQIKSTLMQLVSLMLVCLIQLFAHHY